MLTITYVNHNMSPQKTATHLEKTRCHTTYVRNTLKKSQISINIQLPLSLLWYVHNFSSFFFVFFGKNFTNTQSCDKKKPNNTVKMPHESFKLAALLVYVIMGQEPMIPGVNLGFTFDLQYLSAVCYNKGAPCDSTVFKHTNRELALNGFTSAISLLKCGCGAREVLPCSQPVGNLLKYGRRPSVCGWVAIRIRSDSPVPACRRNQACMWPPRRCGRHTATTTSDPTLRVVLRVMTASKCFGQQTAGM